MARAALGMGGHYTPGLVRSELILLLREALQALGAPSELEALRLHARLLARLAAALQPSSNPDEPIQLARRALAATADETDLRTRMDVDLAAGSALSALPDDDFFSRSAFEGDRAVAFLARTGRLAVFDLSDVIAPRMVSLLDLQLEESDLTLAGDRVLAVGRSRLPVDAPPDDDIARGPQALALVDIANPAAPRVMDRVTLGSFDSVQAGVLELRGDRALFSYYEEFPTILYRESPRMAAAAAPICGSWATTSQRAPSPPPSRLTASMPMRGSNN